MARGRTYREKAGAVDREKHYELDEGHLAKMKGYELYGEKAPASDAERDQNLVNYIASQSVGTPEEIVKILEDRRKILGDYELSLLPRYGSMDIHTAVDSLTLFAKEAMPEAQSWN